MARKNMQIAPNYAMTGALTQTLDAAMDLRIFTYRSAAMPDSTPEVSLTNEMLDRLNYLHYPENIKGLTASNHKPEELMRETIDNLIAHQQLSSYYPKDTLGRINLINQIQNKDIQHALATVVDTETITMKDAFGNEKNWIWNAGFLHIHSDATIGNYKKNNFQHIFIGIYDQEEMDYLSRIATKVEKYGTRSLSQEEDVAFEFLSRFGASMKEHGITALTTDVPENFSLTKISKESFKTVDNFKMAQNALKQLGDTQIAASYSGSVPEGIERLIDNAVEVLVNRDSMITGWNVPYDINRIVETVEGVPGATELLKKKLQSYGLNPDNYSVSDLRIRQLDPLHDIIYPASSSARQVMLHDMYGTDRAAKDIGTHAFTFDNILPMLQKKYPNNAILQSAHHLAGIDVLQEAAFIFTQDSSINIPMKEALMRGTAQTNKYDKNFAIKGLLFQAQDSGSMGSLQKYNKNVFAVVESSNGDLYTSNGFKYNKITDKWGINNKFSPAAWKEGVTYEVTGIEYFYRDSKTADAIIAGRPEMAGEDIVRLQMRVGLLNESQRLSEMGQETHYIYMPRNTFEKEVGAHFKIIGQLDSNNKPILNSFGEEQAWYINKRINGRRIDYRDNPMQAYRDMNQMAFLDRAERSFTKRKINTNENAVMLREIIDTGSFENIAQNGNRSIQLQRAVQSAVKGDTTALNRIMQGTSLGKTAEQIVSDFEIDKSFNNAWFSNAFTIADTMQKGSLFEQLHRSTIKILNDKYFETTLSKNAHYNRNQLYSRAMDEGVRTIMAMLPPEALQKYPGLVGRPVNDSYGYWLEAAEFIRGFRDEHEVISSAQATTNKWIKISLDNPLQTISSLKRATGLKGLQADNDRLVRRNMISFLDYLQDNGRIDKQAQEEVAAILQDVSNKNTYGIANDISAVFKGLKQRQRMYGWAPEEVMLEHDSFLTLYNVARTELGANAMESVEKRMFNAAKSQARMLVSTEAQTNIMKEELRKLMLGGLDSSTYQKYLANYDDGLRNAASQIFTENKTAVFNYADNLINALHGTGVGISIAGNSVHVNYANTTIDISHLIPKLRSNSVGGLTWMLGDNDTRYIAAAGLKLSETGGLGITSMMDWHQNNIFRPSKSGLYNNVNRMLKNAVAAGDDPLSWLTWALKIPDTELRKYTLSNGNPAFDMRNMIYADTSPILHDKSAVEKVLNIARGRNLSTIQQEAVDVLQNYYDAWGRVRPMDGLREDMALWNLMGTENPVINPIIAGSGIRLNATAKQTSSDQFRVAMADTGGINEMINTPGKMLSHQLDNSLYFRTNRTKQEARILADGNITDLAFGPRFATKAEQTIANVTEGNINFSNRVVLNTLEANDAVKSQIYDMLVNKYNNDKTIARVFGFRFMPHEGGGLISSRIVDALQSPLAYQKTKWNPLQMYGDMSPGYAKEFMAAADLQFAKTADGFEEFTGYGKGLFVPKDIPYDPSERSYVWKKYNQFFKELRGTEAKQDAILNVVYMTRTGNQIVDEATLKASVDKALRDEGKTAWTSQEWTNMANSMYESRLVAQNIFDTNVTKLGVDSEKHESLTMVRGIGQYWNGETPATAWQADEKLLHDIFAAEEFDSVAGRLSTDFRTNGTLSSKWYYDIANLNTESPLFQGKEGNAIRTMVREKVGAAKNLTDVKAIDAAFYEMMDKARHRLSDDIAALTGANFLGASIGSMASHGNYDMLLYSTTNWLEQQMQKNRGAIAMTNELRRADFARAVELINQSGAITDRSGRALSFTIDPITGAAIIETNRFYINEEKLKSLYRFNGNTIDASISMAAAGQEYEKALSGLRDVNLLGGFFAHRAEARFFVDYPGSDKLYRMSDRELVSYTNTLFEDDIVNRIRKGLNNDTRFKELFAGYIDDEGKLLKEFEGKSMWGAALDAHFRDAAYMRPTKGTLLGEVMYDANRKYLDDPYRQYKTRDLVSRLGNGSHVAQAYADEMYQTASLRQAAAFNAHSINEMQLLSDKGKISRQDLASMQFFRNVGINDVDTFKNIGEKTHMASDNIFKHNLLVNVTDASLGLTEATLGIDKIALAGLEFGEEGEAEFQKAFSKAQKTYEMLKKTPRSSQEFNDLVNDYRNSLYDAVRLQKEYASGKIKTSVPAKLLKPEIAGSINRKVAVQQTSSLDNALIDKLSEYKYNGESLADLYRKKQNVNFAIVSEANLADMGFNDEYFKRIGVNKEKWLEKARTVGISGKAHRWPSDYWGSTMAVQIYVSKDAGKDSITYDAITAAFLKADSDGDTAQLVLNSTRNASGQYIDALSASMGNKFIDETAQKNISALQRNHDLQMTVQIFETNKMVKAQTDYQKEYDALFQRFSGKVRGDVADPLAKFAKKDARMDLFSNIMYRNPDILTDKSREEIRDAFNQHRERIAAAIEKSGDTKFATEFRGASVEDAAIELRKRISESSAFRNAVKDNLGQYANAANTAFRNATTLVDATTMAIQRMARKGVGLADTPFTAMDFLRMNALAADKAVISNTENVAMDLIKELTKEELLTPKKMNLSNVTEITHNLDTLNTMLDKIMKNGKDNVQLKEEFSSFIENIARPAEDRYQAASLLAEFGIEGKLNKEKGSLKLIAEKAYDGYVKSVESLRQNTSVFNLLQANVSNASRGFKGTIGTLLAVSATGAGKVNRAIAESNGIEDVYRHLSSDSETINQVRKNAAEIIRPKAGSGKIVEKAIRDFRPGKSLAISMLGLAGAAVFGGYAGGNPARPAQQQAQEIQEQNPPPRAINMADPSLTASSRKQAGYVININAQTQKDKEYASRLITQAVTKNFQDTNVNVSMNVNQQPGNISGNDLMDYLEQALY